VHDEIDEPVLFQELAALKPSGSSTLIVFQIVRGPAKPIRALGSAMMKSPSMAKLAVTPPVVGSASRLMNNPPASSSRARAALVLAICISDSADSCMRAPPEQLTISSGSFSSAAASIVSVIFSPTTLPIEPIMNVGSITAIMIGRPLMNPLPQTTASFCRFAAARFEAVLVGFFVDEFQRIGRLEIVEQLFEAAGIDQAARCACGPETRK
jgi:hypothetical protein